MANINTNGDTKDKVRKDTYKSKGSVVTNTRGRLMKGYRRTEKAL
jgi:hypothetical protein